jgi:peptide/nickel transport system substrate-binding protein
MRSSLRTRVIRSVSAGALALAVAIPAALPATAIEGFSLRIATDQDLLTLNPWGSYSYADYEVFQIQYDTLVSWGDNFEPVPGFAVSWTPSADNLSWTFKIREGMKWSDGTPATCEDVRSTWQVVLDAEEQEKSLGYDYLNPYLTNAGLKAVSCTDPLTFVAEQEFPSPLILQTYVPIMPAHIWKGKTLDQVGNPEAPDYFENEPPVVGTGPFVVTSWDPDKFIRFERNPNYWGETGAATEVIIQKLAGPEQMVEALKNDEIDYVRGVSPDQFDALKTEADITVVEGLPNGYTYLAYNLYPKDIPDGGASTTALRDVAFRDALNWAIDNEHLADRVIKGYGTPGTTQVPPFHSTWHVPPANPRTFDIPEAQRRLAAAGYETNAQGQLLDKEDKPITLRLTWPASEEDGGAIAEFIKEWWGQLGITVQAQVTEDDTLINQLLLPEAGGTADWDTYIWGWGGDPDPTSLLSFFTTDEIGGLNDTGYSNPEYDQLFLDQIRSTVETERHAMIQKMQEIFYRDAIYNIPYYDSELHAYRTDRFLGWRNQAPENGTPLFGFGYGGYVSLIDAATASPSPEPSVAASAGASAAPSAAASPVPGDGGTTTGDSTLPLAAGVAVVGILVVGGIVLLRRRSASPAGDDEDEE